ncbi:MAG TPA: CHAT domain-containing protein, partial [Kofleriaceae bacterium]|nr:CHAT domain-containing protein [Kofleriaceae bacterium]
ALQRWLTAQWLHMFLGGGILAAATILAIVLLSRAGGESENQVEQQIAGELRPHRSIEERLPFVPLDRHRAYDVPRAGTARREPISEKALSVLEALPQKTGLIAAYLSRGQLDMAEDALLRAGPGDDLDVERAFVAEHKGHLAKALALLDQVLARTPHHAQAMWNRAIVLTKLDLPRVAAEAFNASATLLEHGWSDEAKDRTRQLRRDADLRAQQWQTASAACAELSHGTVPDLGIVRRHASVCRPALNEAVRRAQTRDEVMQLLPVAEVIDAESEDTASSELVKRTAAADFKIRGPSVALYRKLTSSSRLSAEDKAQIVAKLRTSRQIDLVLGALPRAGMLHDHIDEYVRLALATRDPYFAEIAVEYDAQVKQDSGKWLEAELELRDAVTRCTKREVELRCAYLQKSLANLYVKRHLPTEATRTALGALERSRRLGLYWDERLLFVVLAEAARFARDDSQIRAYLREAELRDDECAQQRVSHEELANVELAELRFASARAELDNAPTCGQPPTLLRAEIEAGLAHVDGTPDRIARLREDFDRTRRSGQLTLDKQAYLDACEGELVAASDPPTARSLLSRAIDASDKLGIDDVTAMKARSAAYNTLLGLGAKDLEGPALLALFAAAGRVPPRDGCALGALIDGERLLLVARDAEHHVQQVFDPHAFKTPDFDARMLVPAKLLHALSSCARVDVIALPPLYGQPHLLPPEIAWSYRGPAAAPAPSGPRRQVALTIEDARPPAELGLAKLMPASHAPRGEAIDEVVVSGDEATPQRVRKELAFADFAEIHAHGFVDLGLSDVSLIALSPQRDGSFALTARTIASLKLPRAPFIALAACHAAYTAPYLHEPWSLPYAFLLAGARGVIASTTEIPDKDAGNFFRAIGDQILQGADPATVLRDQRMQRRADAANWVQDVVLFD